MHEAKEEARRLLEEALGIKVRPEDVKASDIADLSSAAAFRLAGSSKKKPEELATDIAGKIKPRGLISKAEALGGYLNFTLDYDKFTKHVFSSVLVSEGDYGKPLVSPEGKVVLEHTSVNPSGPIHVGRLRNSIIGDSLRRILSFAGYDVETRYWVNDIGKQIAIIALGMEEDVPADSRLEEEYSRYAKKKDFMTFLHYVSANRAFEGDESFRLRVQELIQQAEGGDHKSLELMKNTAKTCLEGQEETFERLGISFDFFDYESDLLGSDVLDYAIGELKANRLWVEKDAGFGLDLSGLGLDKRSGVTVLLRKDGTTVYLARDVAYHLMKLKRGDRLINVLGEDHKFEFQELKAILKEVFRIDKPVDALHYSFVSFEGGKLSTRRGETAPVDQLLDEAVDKAGAEVEKRSIASREIAPAIGIGAVKYHIIKTAPAKPIEFSWKDALSFEGESSPYIQYVHARSCRILEKAEENPKSIDVEDIDTSLEDIEKQLIKEISLFPDVVESAASELKPNLIAGYLYNLASTYSRFYIQCPVLSADEKTRRRRILIVHSVREVTKTGLALLGIDAPERM
jgi:arginyl-tRNA synthetase